MAGLHGAYAPISPDGAERIYISASWLELGTPEQIEAVLLEEALTRARCAPASSAAAALVRAAVCAPLPGLDYHLDAALFNTKVFWDFVAALVDDGGRDAETAAAHLGLDLEQLERDAHAAARAAPLPTAVEILRDVRRGRWGATRRATRLFVARRLWLGVLVDALLSPAAPGAVATAAPVSLEELSRRTKIPEPALEKLARRAPIFAGAVARFCRRLNWTCVADGLDGEEFDGRVLNSNVKYPKGKKRWVEKEAVDPATLDDGGLLESLDSLEDVYAVQSFDLQYLRNACKKVGIKAGGDMEQCSARLWKIKGLSPDVYLDPSFGLMPTRGGKRNAGFR